MQGKRDAESQRNLLRLSDSVTISATVQSELAWYRQGYMVFACQPCHFNIIATLFHTSSIKPS